MDLLPDGRLHLLIPDRTSTAVRRLVIDPVERIAERLEDVPMPRTGARIHGRSMIGGSLLVSVSVIREMLLMSVDLTDLTLRW